MQGGSKEENKRMVEAEENDASDYSNFVLFLTGLRLFDEQFIKN